MAASRCLERSNLYAGTSLCCENSFNLCRSPLSKPLIYNITSLTLNIRTIGATGVAAQLLLGIQCGWAVRVVKKQNKEKAGRSIELEK